MNTGLTSNSVLRLSDCHVSVKEDGLVLSAPSGKSLTCRTDVLELLAFFSEPRSLAEAARQPLMAHDWVHYTRTILSLLEAGILDNLSARGPVELPRLDSEGFGSAAEHIAMLNDRDRTGKYLAAIRGTVRSGDRVIDLGCGTGVLAAAAAQAGAREVHAIERSRIASAAAAFFERNHLADVITLHRAAARDVRLDRRADLLVTEIIGNEPLSERILEHVIDVRTRLLEPDARIIPAGLDLYAQCLRVDSNLVDQHRFSADNQRRWSEWYGLDFHALMEANDRTPGPVDVSPRLLARSKPCSDPVLVHSFDLADVASADLVTRFSIPVTDSGANAVWVSFVVRLNDELEISRLYRDLNEGDQSSWYCRIWLLASPMSAGPGGTVDIEYRHTPLGTRVELLRQQG